METHIEKVRIPLEGTLWKMVADQTTSDLFLCLKNANGNFSLYKKGEESLVTQAIWNLKDEWVACRKGLFLFETIPQSDLPILQGIKVTNQEQKLIWTLPNVKYIGCSPTGICVQENEIFLWCTWEDGTVQSTSSTPFPLTNNIQSPDVFYPNTPHYPSILTFVSSSVSVQNETPFEYLPTWFGFVVVCYIDQPSNQQLALLFSHQGKELERETLIEKTKQWKTPSIICLNEQLIGLGERNLICWKSSS